MDIEGEFSLDAPVEHVWKCMHDPQVLKQCIPGCQALEQVEDERYTCQVLAKYGPVKATFDSELEVSEMQFPTSYVLSGSGKGGAAGFGKGVAEIVLKEADGTTTVRYSAKIHAGGRIAQVGARLMQSTTRKLVDSFFTNFEAYMADDETI